MKTSKKIMRYAIAVIAVAVFSCTDEPFGPVLPDSSTFVSPVFMNNVTADSKELLPEEATALYEKFTWERSQYGVNLSTDYVLEIDDNNDFSSPQKLAETSRDSVLVTVEDMNDAMLALGLPGFEEATVYIRIKSTINSYESEPLYSSTITRTATTYQTSECGNFCTIGLVGSATPGGWDTDTDMRLADATKADKYTWTITVYLTAGAVKFRANDAWEANWGASDFPSGTGTQGGPDIPVATAGYYKITLNDNTGAYTFTALPGTEYTSVGILGSGTPGGWDTDTNLTQDAGNPHVWTGTITLTDGAAKFRANDSWDNNWGGSTYPSGYAAGGGADIPVKAGTYVVRFNDATGEYAFMNQGNAAPYDKVGIIGPAQGGGWDSDTDLIQNPGNPFLWSKRIVLNDGEAKFRADDGWDVNWGASTFPGGTGTQGGPNVPVKGGTYFVAINTGTGEYYFLR